MGKTEGRHGLRRKIRSLDFNIFQFEIFIRYSRGQSNQEFWEGIWARDINLGFVSRVFKAMRFHDFMKGISIKTRDSSTKPWVLGSP